MSCNEGASLMKEWKNEEMKNGVINEKWIIKNEELRKQLSEAELLEFEFFSNSFGITSIIVNY